MIFFIHGMIFCENQSCYAQNTIIFNPFHDHFLLNKGSVSPSAYSNEETFLNLYYKNRTGILSDIRDFYVDAITGINQSQVLGVSIYSEQETSLFTKTKFSLIYAYEINLKGKLKWSLGTKASLANISFQGTGANVGGGDLVGDISLSTTLRHGTSELNIAVHQLPNSPITPIDFTFILYRYVDVMFTKKFNLSLDWTMENGINYKQNKSVNLWSIDNMIKRNDEFGIMFRYGKENSISIGGFASLNSVFKGLSLSASYSNFFRQENLKFNAFSLGILWKKPKI